MAHPKVEEEFKNAGVPIPDNSPDIVEREFFEQTLENSRKTSITKIIRTLKGDKDYLLYSQIIYGNTLEGNRRNLHKSGMGKYKFPIFVYAFDEKGGKPKPTDRVDRYEDRYEIPYSPANVKKILAKDQMKTNTAFKLMLGNQGYVVRNKDDFINLPIDKLVQKVTGKTLESLALDLGYARTEADTSEQTLRNTQQQQEAARRRMYEIEFDDSSSSFGPTADSRAESAPSTTAPDDGGVVVMSGQNTAAEEAAERELGEEEKSEQVKIEQKPGEKKGVGQSRAKEKISEDVGVVLHHVDTGVKENMTKDSITIEEPQGQAARELMEEDRKKREEEKEKEENTQKRKRLI
jgi:hypothetical protein